MTLLELCRGPTLLAKVPETMIDKETTKDETIAIELTSAEPKQRSITSYFPVLGTVRSMLSIAS